jgi:phosphoglycolate phosphatase
MIDVNAARAAGFKILCVSYGYNHGRDIREANPDAVVDSLAKLPALMGT